jgi:hypothetical protein
VTDKPLASSADLDMADKHGTRPPAAAEEFGTGGHDLVVSLGDCELYGTCQCGKPLGTIKPNQSLDELARPWEHHVMTEVFR